MKRALLTTKQKARGRDKEKWRGRARVPSKTPRTWDSYDHGQPKTQEKSKEEKKSLKGNANRGKTREGCKGVIIKSQKIHLGGNRREENAPRRGGARGRARIWQNRVV